MKKLLFSAAFAALVLSGCTKDIENPVDMGAIRFTTSIADHATRVEGAEWGEGDPVGVYMFDASASSLVGAHASNRKYVISGGELTADGAPVYYPAGGAPVHFAAYHPYKADSEINDHLIRISIAEQTPQTAIDLMYAETTGMGYTAGDVDLQFKHELVKLVFNLTEANPTTMVGVSATLTGFSTEAHFDLNSQDVTEDTRTNDVEITGFVRSATATAATVEFIVFPEIVETPVLKVTLANGTTATYTFGGSALDLKSGSKYPYNLRLIATGDEPGEVTIGDADIDDWTSEEPVYDDVVVDEGGNGSASKLVINEIVGANYHGGIGRYIEVYNGSDTAIDLTGYTIYDNSGKDNGFVFASGTIASKGYFATTSLTSIFTIDADDVITLVDNNGNQLDQVTVPELTDMTEPSYSRIPDGSDTWMKRSTHTIGNPNGVGKPSTGTKLSLEELTGKVFINEFKIMDSEDGEDDWFELYNASDIDIDLSYYEILGNSSRVLTLAEGTTIKAKGFLAYTHNIEFRLQGEEGWAADGTSRADGRGTIALYTPNAEGWKKITDMNTYSTGLYLQLADITMPAVARIPDGGEWVAVATTTKGVSNGGDIVEPPVVDLSKLFINEVKVSDFGSDSKDWVELYNSGEVEIDLAGFTISDSKATSAGFAAGKKIAAGAFAVLEEGVDFTFGLSADGENMTLKDNKGNTVSQVSTPSGLEDDAFPAYARTTDGGSEWAKTANPTRGASNGGGTIVEPPVTDLSKLFINEVKVSDFGSDSKDWVELYNGGNAEIDLAGFTISDSKATSAGFAAGKKIAAGAFAVLEEGVDFTFGLSADGENMTLKDNNGNTIGQVTTPSGLEDDTFPAYARTTDGGSEWAKTATPTRGASNNPNGGDDPGDGGDDIAPAQGFPMLFDNGIPANITKNGNGINIEYTSTGGKNGTGGIRVTGTAEVNGDGFTITLSEAHTDSFYFQANGTGSNGKGMVVTFNGDHTQGVSYIATMGNTGAGILSTPVYEQFTYPLTTSGKWVVCNIPGKLVPEGMTTIHFRFAGGGTYDFFFDNFAASEIR